ncbi:DUF4910 domain-containing protein [Candidatus Pelagibacter sp.]|nr:DUF4910 domain-containing protein [Candidatus Pelagibacter sp.]
MNLEKKTIQAYYKLGKDTLFPICRSITGKGIRKTLSLIKIKIPELKIKKIKSNSRAFDWKIPKEWNIHDAYVLDKDNIKIIDFKINNLHLVGYSNPIDKNIKKNKLLERIHVRKDLPNAIPYVTSYYTNYWGFCLSYNEKLKLIKEYKDSDSFRVVINSDFKLNGNLNYGEVILKGKSKQEILISTYICHPSMANNELSGPIVSMCLIDYFKKIKKLEKTIRFIFIPETIGSIAYLNKNLDHLKTNVIGGYNLSCVGDDRQHSCILSKNENTPSDRALLEAYKKLKIKYRKYSFLERGSDERQYNSPGIDLPIASICRSKHGRYPEYHTSLDNFDIVTEKGITGGYKIAKKSIEILLKKIIPKYKVLCEPQLGKRNLYENISTAKKVNTNTKDLLNFLQYADGKNDIESISRLIKLNPLKVLGMYKILLKNKLL